MPCLLPYRPRWLGERRVGKRSNSYADEIGPKVCEPVHGRAASGTEMEAEFSSLLSVANIGDARAIRADIGFLVKRGCTKRSAGASLTFDAMTGGDKDQMATASAWSDHSISVQPWSSDSSIRLNATGKIGLMPQGRPPQPPTITRSGWPAWTGWTITAATCLPTPTAAPSALILPGLSPRPP